MGGYLQGSGRDVGETDNIRSWVIIISVDRGIQGVSNVPAEIEKVRRQRWAFPRGPKNSSGGRQRRIIADVRELAQRQVPALLREFTAYALELGDPRRDKALDRYRVEVGKAVMAYAGIPEKVSVEVTGEGGGPIMIQQASLNLQVKIEDLARRRGLEVPALQALAAPGEEIVDAEVEG